MKHSRATAVQNAALSPVWNEYLSMTVPEQEWQFFRIQIWDDDGLFIKFLDPISVSETIVVTPGEHKGLLEALLLAKGSFSFSFVSFDYSLHQPIPATLTVTVRYAEDLWDTDPIFNNPHP